MRLLHGDMDKATVFNTSPADQAGRFVKDGFDWLHVVDLNGAIEGASRNAEAVNAILNAVSVPVQLGGGIRTLAAVEAWIEAGISRVILGTVAVRDPELVKTAARNWPEQIAVAVDVRDGKVAVDGWTGASELDPITLARRFDAMHLPNGSVVMDTFTPCASLMLMNSVNPHQFVITSDLDFERTLADPVTFGARYLLLPPPEGYGTLDAVTRAYPTLYADGAPGAELAMEVDLDGCPKLRLYEVLETTQEGGS